MDHKTRKRLRNLRRRLRRSALGGVGMKVRIPSSNEIDRARRIACSAPVLGLFAAQSAGFEVLPLPTQVLSRSATSWGSRGDGHRTPATRRWFPRNAVGMEDWLDGLTPAEADRLERTSGSVVRYRRSGEIEFL